MSASDPKSTPPAADAAKPELTAKQAAALVKGPETDHLLELAGISA